MPLDPHRWRLRAKAPIERRERAFGAAHLCWAIERDLLALMAQRKQRHKRAPEWPQSTPRRDDLQERVWRFVESGHLTPGVMIGVLDTLVMVLAADPITDLERLAIHDQRSGKDGERTPNRIIFAPRRRRSDWDS